VLFIIHYFCSQYAQFPNSPKYETNNIITHKHIGSYNESHDEMM